MNRDLLILSATLISEELQQYFGQLPSSMVPSQGRPALDYIYHEHLNHYNNLYIVVKEEHQFVSEFLMHSQHRIKPIVLPNLGDLAGSLQYGLEQIATGDRAITVLFGDTYIPYMTRHFGGKDVLLYTHSQDSERWTVIEQEEKGQLHFIDKKALAARDHYPIVIGAFHLIHPKRLLQLLQEEPTQPGNRFYQALETYYNERSTELVYVDNWVDYGHSDKYFEQKRRVSARSFNEVRIQPEQNLVIKRSTHTSKFIDEINWFLQLPEALKAVTPNIHYYSLDPAQPYVKMDFYDMLTLHEVFIHGNHALDRWVGILNRLKEVNALFQQHTQTLENARALRHQMYVTKTVQRLEAFQASGRIDATQPLVVNGQTHRSLEEYIQLIEPIAQREGILDDGPFNVIHGDFCFTNILYDLHNDDVMLIDPRGSFGVPGIYGDNRYEWAKLAHSIEGCYDLIIADRFNTENIGNNIIYTIHRHSIHEQIKTQFYETIVPAPLQRQVRLVQALLFFAMLPLHADTPRRQHIMLCRAVELFHDFL